MWASRLRRIFSRVELARSGLESAAAAAAAPTLLPWRISAAAPSQKRFNKEKLSLSIPAAALSLSARIHAARSLSIYQPAAPESKRERQLFDVLQRARRKSHSCKFAP